MTDIKYEDDEYLLANVPRLYDQLIQRYYEIGNKREAGQAYLDKGEFLLDVCKRGDLAYETYECVIDRFSLNSDQEIRKIVEEALKQKYILIGEDDDDFSSVATAYAKHVIENEFDREVISVVDEVCDFLKEVERYENALELYDDVLGKINDTRSELFAEERISVLMNKGICLQLLEREEEAIRVFTEVILRADNDDDLNIADALIRLGTLFVNCDRVAHGISHFDEVIWRYKGINKMQEIAIEAAFKKAGALSELGNSEEATSVYESIIEKYDSNASIGVARYVGRSLLAKARALLLEGNVADATRSFNQVLEHFGASTDPELQQIVERAISERVL